jgi:hypoxanthine phosphoribosyltransferase
MALKADGKIYLSWDDIETLVDNLCKQISEKTRTVTSVTGLQRGGLIPAVMVSHKLNLPYVYSIHPTTLVIDDICDTGETLNFILGGVPTAVLHYKPTAKHKPTFYAQEVGDEWIVYPWERKDSEAIQDYLKK